jgi:hypothetical protein
MTQLSKTEGRLPTAQTELRLDPPAWEGSIRRRANDDRRSAACDPADDLTGDGVS